MGSIEHIANKECDKCSMSSYCSNVCRIDVHKPHQDIMVVADIPNHDDDQRGTFIDDRLLNSVMDKVVGIPLERVYRTYLVKCKPATDVSIKDDEMEICYRNYLLEEIREIRPKVIIALGEKVMYTLTGYKGISKHRGEILETILYDDPNHEEYGETVPVVPTFSPYFVQMAENNLKNFALDIQTAYHIAIDKKSDQTYSTQYVLADTMDKVREVFGYCMDSKIVSFDFEASGLDWWAEDFFVTGIALTFQQGSGYFVPLRHKEPIYNEKNKLVDFKQPIFTEPQVAQIIDMMKELMEADHITKIGHNLRYDLHVAKTLGITKFFGRYFDTMIAHSCIDCTTRHGLKEVIQTYYREFSGYEDEVKKIGFDRCPLKILGPYAANDSDLTYRLGMIFEQELLKDEAQYVHYRNLVMSVFWVLEQMEYDGIFIDRDLLAGYMKEVEKIIEDQEAKMRDFPAVKKFEAKEREIEMKTLIDDFENKLKTAKTPRVVENLKKKIADLKSGVVQPKEPINFASVPQLKKLIYGQHGLNLEPVADKYTKQKNYGTGKEVLIDLKDKTGFLDELQILRSVQKTYGTYLKGIYDRMDRNGYIHTGFQQHIAITGRLSSTNPNMQNIPTMSKIDSDITRKVTEMIKKVFVIPNPLLYVMMQFDLSQAELRVIASYARDTAMMKAYQDGLDIHIMTGSKIAGLTVDEFMKLDKAKFKEWRTKAKSTNFGFIYGMGWEGFKDYAKTQYGVILTSKEAEMFRTVFFDTYRQLEDYHALYKAKAHKFGYVRTFFGRRVYVPDINSFVPRLKGEAERTAINAPIQGTAGEWTLFGLALLRHRLYWYDCSFRNTVHDSLIPYVLKEHVPDCNTIVKDTMAYLPVKKYFGKELEGVVMQCDSEISEKSWKDLEPYEEK